MLYIFIKNVSWQKIRNKLLHFFLPAIQITFIHAQEVQNNFYLNNEIKFERLAIENGLSNNMAFGMTQDKKGFMWFATLDALIKYDGYTLTRYQNNPQDTNSLGDNIVMSVFEDHTGMIWVGTAGGGGVNSFDPQTATWKRYPHNPKIANSMGKGSIEGIAEDHNGMLWFGSTDGLTRYDPKTNHFTLFVNNPKDKYSLSNNRVYSIVVDKAGMLWVGTNEGINLFNPKDERFYTVSGGLKDSLELHRNLIHHIYKDNQGLLWLSSFNHGIYVIDPESKKCIANYHHDLSNPNSIGSDVIFAVTRDLAGSYWVSTEAGLYHFNPQTNAFTLYENKSYLPKTQTKGHIIISDRSGLVWIGTMGRGVIYFSPQPKKFRRYLNDEASLAFGLGSNRMKSFFKSAGRQLYVATSQNLLRFNQAADKFEEVWQIKTIKKNNEDFILTAACEEKPGIFWLGTDHAGIIRYDCHTRKTTSFQKNPTDSTGLADNRVDALYKDRGGRLWACTKGPDLLWYDSTKNKFNRYRFLSANEEPLPNAGIRFIHEDSKGGLWLGISAFHLSLGGDGLYHINLKTGNIVHYKHEPGSPGSLSNNSVTCIYEDKNDIFWIGTYGGGLNRLDAGSGKFTIYTKENGLLSNTVQGIASDIKGNLWINADEGITRFNSTTLKTQQFGTADGLASSPSGVELDDDHTYLSMESDDGDIYFSSNNGYNGVIAFTPATIRDNNFKPPVVITQFKVFDKSYPVTGKEISLPYDQNFLDVEFAALSYFSSGYNQYAYKLDGINDDWVNSGHQRTAHYTNVSPGKHVFRVKGSNNDGVWNDHETTLTIIINPPWWRTWWAYTVYVLLIIGSIWAFTHYRSLNLIRQKKILEKEVVARTAEVVHQKEELQSTLEDLQATQAQLIQSEKMASLGELTAGIAHEIQNPLNFVNNFSDVSRELIEELKSQKEKLKPDEQDEILNDIDANLEKINHHGKRADSIVKGMLQHSRSNAGAKEPTDINALADEYLRLSYHGLRAKNKDFNATMKTEFDASIGKINIVPQDIGRVLLNLINNAFYAVKPPNSLKGEHYEPTVSVSTKKTGDKVILTVSDNGNGIPPALIDKIFQPFFTTKPTGEGTGLGLSLSYDIIKAHGGEIKVDSKVGIETTFTVILPVNNAT